MSHLSRTLAKETPGLIGQTVKINGWVHRIRFMGQKLAFIDLRDRSGIVQAVCYKPDLDEATSALLSGIRPEYVLEIIGEVKRRQDPNPELATGEIEIGVKSLSVLNTSQTPPFEIEKDTKEVSEELRLKYRYLDLRTERMKKNIILRHRVIHFFRQHLIEQGFLEIETPILTKGTPEGAREFLVPSRIYPGEF